MSDTEIIEQAKIEFPCENYPVKIIGDNHPDFKTLVLEIIERHAPGFDQENLVTRDSSNGRYLSLQVQITALGVEQLQSINEDLRATGLVKMVL